MDWCREGSLHQPRGCLNILNIRKNEILPKTHCGCHHHYPDLPGDPRLGMVVRDEEPSVRQYPNRSHP